MPVWERYPPGVSTKDVNGLLRELAQVLEHLARGEERLIHRLRDIFQPLQVEEIQQSDVTEVPPFESLVGAAPPKTIPPETINRDDDAPPIQRAAAAQVATGTSPSNMPIAAEFPPWPVAQPTSATGKRDYNYFAELDDKLASLRNRELSRPELTDSP
jgi:hypothetical protein